MKKTLIIHPDELSETWIDRMADLKIDVLSMHPVGGTVAHKTAAELAETAKTPAFRKLVDYAKSRGLQIEYEIHAAGYLVPRDLFQSHPEYFRINPQGERCADFNFCMTNPQAVELALERASQLADGLYGSSDNYYLWLDDGEQSYCHCENCGKFSPSDLQMQFLNKVLHKLQQKNPKARLAYLAYYETEEPPTIPPADGIFMEYAPYLRDMEKSVCQMSQEALDRLDRLIAFFGKDKCRVLDYWYDNSWFSGYQKPPKKLTVRNGLIKQDIAFYKSKGIADFAAFACYLGADYQALHGEPDLSAFAEV